MFVVGYSVSPEETQTLSQSPVVPQVSFRKFVESHILALYAFSLLRNLEGASVSLVSDLKLTNLPLC